MEALWDAHDQAKKAKSQEGPREGNQASEKTEESSREDGQSRHPERRSPLAVFQHEPRHPARPPGAEDVIRFSVSQAPVLIRASSPATQALDTPQTAFSCPGILSQPPFSMRSDRL